MLVRRDHHAHGGSHHHAVAHSENRPARRLPWRRVFLVAAYLSAVLLVPLSVGAANFAAKFAALNKPLPSTVYSGALLALPTPDPSKKIAVVLSGADGAEIGATLEAYEILARSGVLNVYSVAPERTVMPLYPGPDL